jgi:hypothetical protein
MHENLARSIPANTANFLPRLARVLLARLHAFKWPLLWFQLLSYVFFVLWSISESVPFPTAVSRTRFVYASLTMLSVPVVLTLAHQLSVDSVSSLVSRPLRFFVLHTMACAAAQIVTRFLAHAMGFGSPLPDVAIRIWVITGVHFMLNSTALTWLSFLYIKGREDQARLYMLLSKRLSLTRQVDHSRLLVSRARVDPLMVARVLRAIRARYRSDRAAAALVLRKLVDYLRLAMQRGSQGRVSFSAECKLVRAYLALREAETGTAITIGVAREGSAEPPPAALYVIVQNLFDDMAPSATAAIGLSLRASPDEVILEVRSRSWALSDEGLARFRACLASLAVGKSTMTHLVSESGENCYAIKTIAS